VASKRAPKIIRTQPAEPFAGHAQKKKPKFPETTDMAWIFGAEDMVVVRHNSAFLSRFHRLTLLPRPTQMGKSTLLILAKSIYDGNTEAPKLLTTIFYQKKRTRTLCFTLTFYRWPKEDNII
jgi:hypothetical protein